MGAYASRTLDEFFNIHVFPYPGHRISVTTLMLYWVWQRDVDKIVNYFKEKDPFDERHIAGPMRNTVDCVRHYRHRYGKPLFTKDENKRYVEFNRMRQTGYLEGHRIIGDKENPDIHYIMDCRFVEGTV